MNPVAITIGLGWSIAGLVSIGAALPLLQGKVGRNALYGVRFPQSFQSDNAWFAINCYGAKRMILWALPMIAAGIAAFWLPRQASPLVVLICGFAPLLCVVIPVIDTWLFARRYAAARRPC